MNKMCYFTFTFTLTRGDIIKKKNTFPLSSFAVHCVLSQGLDGLPDH